jgi:hypothetical protein
MMGASRPFFRQDRAKTLAPTGSGTYHMIEKKVYGRQKTSLPEDI